MKSFNYVVVSQEEGLYDTVSRQISEESPDASVTRADSVREGVAILERTGAGIIFTDLKNLDLTFPVIRKSEMEKTRRRERPSKEKEKNDGLSYIPEIPAGNTKADIGYIKQYIRMHLEGDLSLTHLASVACLSPNYLSSLFKEKEGEPLKKYIERHRIERAAYLLLTEELPMAEISRKTGYRHCSHFCSIFKQYYGTSPLQYRLTHRGEKKKRQQEK